MRKERNMNDYGVRRQSEAATALLLILPLPAIAPKRRRASLAAALHRVAMCSHFFVLCLSLTLFCCIATAATSESSSALSDSQLAEIKFDQKLNASISLDSHFRDENGKDVNLGDYFS